VALEDAMNQRILVSLLLLIFLLVSVLTAQQIFTTINDPNGSIGTSDVTGINNTGQIVGTSFALGKNQGYLDTNGSFTALKDPNGTEGTTAKGINDTGQVTGSYQDSASLYHGYSKAQWVRIFQIDRTEPPLSPELTSSAKETR
jgi:uncharacterized membrane protein